MTDHEYDGYSAKYAAFYLVDTMQWATDACQDPDCIYCHGRPPTAHGLTNDIDKLILDGWTAQHTV